MEILPLTQAHRPWADQVLRREWDGPLIVSKGRLLDGSRLPGFVALEQGEPTGLILYDVRGDQCEVAALISYQEGRGVGGALINRVAQSARQMGCRRLWLITTNDNLHAIRFYQRRGFTLAAVDCGAINRYRETLKPGIPILGSEGIPIRDEFEFERLLEQQPG